MRTEHKGQSGPFTLNVQALDNNPVPVHVPTQSKEEHKEEEKKVLIEPKTRAAGGVWLSASDFPHCFQHVIIYHNISKMTNQQFYIDKWVDAH